LECKCSHILMIFQRDGRRCREKTGQNSISTKELNSICFNSKVYKYKLL
jgi:hypothetical protein